MRRLLMVLPIILILASCGTTKPAIIVPPMEKYCPAPVRPVIEQKDIWTVQDLLQMNLIIIDYSLKLEGTIKCWEAK